MCTRKITSSSYREMILESLADPIFLIPLKMNFIDASLNHHIHTFMDLVISLKSLVYHVTKLNFYQRLVR